MAAAAVAKLAPTVPTPKKDAAVALAVALAVAPAVALAVALAVAAVAALGEVTASRSAPAMLASV